MPEHHLLSTYRPTAGRRLSAALLLVLTGLSSLPALAQADEIDPENDTHTEEPLPLTGVRPAVILTPTTRNHAPAAATVELAVDGRAKVAIIVAPGASEDVRAAAADAARVLANMTGARFAVETGDGAKGLVIGTIADFPHPELAEALKVNNGFEGNEAYAIRTTPGRVLILGATSLGATDGLYRLLHELGCRWLAPSPTWEVIPTQPTLRWGLDITDRPRILSRVIWYKTDFDYEADATPWGTTPRQDRATWGRRNAHLDGLNVQAGHAYATIIRSKKSELESHPEYFPLIKGERRVNIKTPTIGQLELGNPALRQLIVDYARTYFRKNPTATMVSLEPNDGGGWSESPESKALGSVSNAVFGVANEVARMLQREFPGKMVGLYAYREHAEPPSFPLEPNVYVQITGLLFSKRSGAEVISEWEHKHTNLGFYDYYAPYEWHFDELPGTNAASINYVTSRVRAEAAGPATSVSAEASGSWAGYGLSYYIANRLMWDPEQDVTALRNDYLQAAFGPAAAAMDRYYQRSSPDSHPLVSKELVYAMIGDLQEARKAAAGRPDVLARLRDLEQYIRYLELDWRVGELLPTAPYAEREAAFVALMRHAFRMRYTYMIHWGLAAQRLWKKRGVSSGVVVIQQKAPRIVLQNNSLGYWVKQPENPWRDAKPFSLAEIDADFQSAASYFRTPPIETGSFSSALTPVKWPAPAPGAAQPAGKAPKAKPLPSRAPAPTVLSVQGGHIRIALFAATDHDTLHLEVEPGNIRQRRTQARAWHLTATADEKPIATGNVVATDAKPVVGLRLAVPHRGTYVFDIVDNNGGLTVRVPPAAPAVAQLAVGKPINHNMRGKSWYFYVPKHTREVQFFYDAWAPEITLAGPNGQVVYTDAHHRNSVTHVAVPPGLDGGVWRVEAVRIGPLMLFNVPPYLATSPERLLVPTDVAERDKLELPAAPKK